MNYDVRFATVGESALRQRRTGALAAILALAALLGTLALMSPDAGAPEPAAVESAAAATVIQTDQAVATAEAAHPPLDCSLEPAHPRDCTYY
jgi:uncharacterized iron-regulated membrane protein